MSRRQRADKDTSNTKKEIAVIAAAAMIPVAGTLIAPALIAKKLLPKVTESAKKRKGTA
ncbi:MAG: hypothetical protein K6G82_03085 [Ruminococcus sp.]|nr:hypothetical protein [Ruminococcus sp.]